MTLAGYEAMVDFLQENRATLTQKVSKEDLLKGKKSSNNSLENFLGRKNDLISKLHQHGYFERKIEKQQATESINILIASLSCSLALTLTLVPLDFICLRIKAAEIIKQPMKYSDTLKGVSSFTLTAALMSGFVRYVLTLTAMHSYMK